MMRWVSLGCLLALLGAAPVRAQEPAPNPSARVTFDFQGPLRDAIRALASKGSLNVVVKGAMDDSVDIHLENVLPEEALQTLANAYKLDLRRTGSIWTLRPMTEDEREASDAPPLRELPSRRFEEEKNRVSTRDMVVGAQDTVDDAVVFGGHLRVDGHVEGDAIAFGGGVYLGPKAVVDGDVVALGGAVMRDEGSRVGGQVMMTGGTGGFWKTVAQTVNDNHVPGWDKAQVMSPRKEDTGFKLTDLLLRFALLFALGFLLKLFAPTRMREMEQALKHDVLKSGLTGLVGMVVLFPLTLLLVVTLVGIPFAFLLWVLVGLAILMGFTAMASEVGMRTPVMGSNLKTQAVVLAIGLALVLILCEIPVLGMLVFMGVSLVSFGVVIRTRFGSRTTPQAPTPPPVLPTGEQPA